MSNTVFGRVSSRDKLTGIYLYSYAQDQDNWREVFDMGVLKLARLISVRGGAPIVEVLEGLNNDPALKELLGGDRSVWYSSDKHFRFTMSKDRRKV